MEDNTYLPGESSVFSSGTSFFLLLCGRLLVASLLLPDSSRALGSIIVTSAVFPFSSLVRSTSSSSPSLLMRHIFTVSSSNSNHFADPIAFRLIRLKGPVAVRRVAKDTNQILPLDEGA